MWVVLCLSFASDSAKYTFWSDDGTSHLIKVSLKLSQFILREAWMSDFLITWQSNICQDISLKTDLMEVLKEN